LSDPSTDTEILDSQEPVEDLDVTSAPSTEGEPQTMLDAVQAALDGKRLEDSPASGDDKAEGDSKPKAEVEAAKKPEDDLSEEALARLNKETQKRIRDLVGTRKKLEKEISDFKPKAEQYDVITSQIRQTGLDQNDLAVTFDIATALKRGDLFGARKLLEPIFVQVMHATGGILPDDLRKEVETNAISRDRATELATARAAAQQAAFQGRETAARQQAAAAQQLTQSVVGSVNDWEKQKAATDPDWKLKAPEIMRSLKLSLLEGNRPTSVAQAVQMAEAALAEVNDRFRAYRPAPRPMRAVVSSGGTSRPSTANPKNMLDVVNGALG